MAAASFDYGFTLPNGSKIIHGEGVMVKDAYPPELKIPGQLHVFSPGGKADAQTPCFCGPHGIFPFDVNLRMPRHVHMSPQVSGPGKRYIVEKILVMNGVALAELSGEIYVVPPNTMVLIGPGVPHTWTACPPGLDLQDLGISGDEKIVSEGKFIAVFEYEMPTAFFPTAQTHVLKAVCLGERSPEAQPMIPLGGHDGKRVAGYGSRVGQVIIDNASQCHLITSF
jgi:hypothetical protein